MEAKLALSLILAVVSAEWYGVESFSNGAPSPACSTISPDPGSHGAQPQASPVPYSINLAELFDAGGYTPDKTYFLSLIGLRGVQFRGLLVVATRFADNSLTPVGTFTVIDANTQLSFCSPRNGGITHSNGTDKRSVSFQWTAPPQGTGPIVFRFAVVQVMDTYWAAQSSIVFDELVAPSEVITTTAGVASTDAQTSTIMMATDTSTGATSGGQSGGVTDMQGGGTTTLAESAQTDPRSSAVKQSGVGFWTSILLIVMVILSKAIMKTL